MPLALRADLAARAIRRIGSLVGASILERLAACNDLSEATRSHLNRELCARLAESSASTAGDATAPQLVRMPSWRRARTANWTDFS